MTKQRRTSNSKLIMLFVSFFVLFVLVFSLGVIVGKGLSTDPNLLARKDQSSSINKSSAKSRQSPKDSSTKVIKPTEKPHVTDTEAGSSEESAGSPTPKPNTEQKEKVTKQDSDSKNEPKPKPTPSLTTDSQFAARTPSPADLTTLRKTEPKPTPTAKTEATEDKKTPKDITAEKTEDSMRGVVDEIENKLKAEKTETESSVAKANDDSSDQNTLTPDEGVSTDLSKGDKTQEGTEIVETELFPPPTSSGKYTVQIGSFQKESEAIKFAKMLNSKGYPVFIKPMTTEDNKTWHRVRVGTFNDIEAARLYGDNMKAKEKEVNLIFITLNN